MADEESIVIKQREPFSDAILPQNADELAKFMDGPTVRIAELLTGALAAGPKAWLLITGHLVQGILKGQLFQQVSREIKKLIDDSKIPPEFADEKKFKYGFRSWVDLLKTIDDDPPDADLLKALMAMFYGVNRINATDSEKMLSYRLFQIAKRLTSGELLLLKTLWDALSKGLAGDGNRNLEVWAEKIAKSQGHNLTALVMKDQHALMEENLISGYDLSAHPTNKVVDDRNGRLTDLGIAFCKNIDVYRIEASS
jgi:hypothetical protein